LSFFFSTLFTREAGSVFLCIVRALCPRYFYPAILIINMSLRGALVLNRSSLLITGDCFVGKSKNPPRNDILKITAVRHHYLNLDEMFEQNSYFQITHFCRFRRCVISSMTRARICIHSSTGTARKAATACGSNCLPASSSMILRVVS
jgi:hypothetical protein